MVKPSSSSAWQQGLKETLRKALFTFTDFAELTIELSKHFEQFYIKNLRSGWELPRNVLSGFKVKLLKLTETFVAEMKEKFLSSTPSLGMRLKLSELLEQQRELNFRDRVLQSRMSALSKTDLYSIKRLDALLEKIIPEPQKWRGKDHLFIVLKDYSRAMICVV